MFFYATRLGGIWFTGCGNIAKEDDGVERWKTYVVSDASVDCRCSSFHLRAKSNWEMDKSFPGGSMAVEERDWSLRLGNFLHFAEHFTVQAESYKLQSSKGGCKYFIDSNRSCGILRVMKNQLTKLKLQLKNHWSRCMDIPSEIGIAKTHMTR